MLFWWVVLAVFCFVVDDDGFLDYVQVLHQFSFVALNQQTASRINLEINAFAMPLSVLNDLAEAMKALEGKKVGSQSTNSSKPEWYKVLPKPLTFEPKDREAELSGFRDWWWQVEQYIVAVDSSYGQDLLYIRSHLDEEMPLVEQDPEKTRRSGFLYGLLASLLKQRPLMLLKGIEQGNGMEAVRQLFEHANLPQGIVPWAFSM